MGIINPPSSSPRGESISSFETFPSSNTGFVLLAYGALDPSSMATVSSGDSSLISLGLTLNFTAPAAGVVEVRIGGGYWDGASSGLFGLMENSTAIFRQVVPSGGSAYSSQFAAGGEVRGIIGGLSSGAQYSWTVGVGEMGSDNFSFYYGGTATASYGRVYAEVWSVPTA